MRAENGLTLFLVCILGVGNGRERAVEGGVVKGVPPKRSFGKAERLHAERSQLLLHVYSAWEYAHQAMRLLLRINQRFR